MTRVKVVVTNYGFRKPPMMTEENFLSYKQIFTVDSSFDMAPKKSFWDEFNLVRWNLIIIVFGCILASLWEPLCFIPGLGFVFLVMGMITGTAQSMFNYQSFLNVKNEYYTQLKGAIISSLTYSEFKRKVANL